MTQRDPVVVASANEVPANLDARGATRDLQPAVAEQRGAFALGEDAIGLDPHVLALKEHSGLLAEGSLPARRHAHLAVRQRDESPAQDGNRDVVAREDSQPGQDDVLHRTGAADPFADRMAEDAGRIEGFNGQRGNFDPLRIDDLDYRRVALPDDQSVRPAASNPDVGAIHDAHVFLVPSAQHADFPASRRQGVHRILDGRELPVALRAIPDDDRAATLDLAERPEARAAILNLADDTLARRVDAPANQGQGREKLPRSERGSLVGQNPRHDFVRRVGPGGNDPIGAGKAKVAEGDFEAGAGQRNRRVGDIRVIGLSGVARAAGPDTEIKKSLRRGLVAVVEEGRLLRVVQPVDHGLRNGRLYGDTSRIRIETCRDGREMTLQFPDFFLIGQERAPRENFDRLPGNRLREFIPWQRQELDDIQPLLFDHLHPVERRGIVKAPDEAVRRGELHSNRLILRSQITAQHGRLAQIIARWTARETHREPALRPQFAAPFVEPMRIPRGIAGERCDQ